MEYELSRPVIVEELPSHGLEIDLKPTPEELAAIAARLDLVSLDEFSGKLSIRPEMGREIAARGELKAFLTQTCVVTGDPVKQELTFELTRRYSETASEFDDTEEDDEIIGDSLDEGPDPIVDGIVDLGEAAVEELALQIPPYPRAPGAEFTDIIDDTADGEAMPNPFSKLESLKNDLESKS